MMKNGLNFRYRFLLLKRKRKGKGGNMTNKDFSKAKQIKQDLKALKDLTISVGASKELIDSWKNWANGEIDRLNKEFDEL